MESQLRFSDSHEWVRDNGDGTATLGISEHAQSMLGDVVFIDLPEIGNEVEAGENFSLVESVKAASDIYAPISGEIIEVNEDLESTPELINDDPYEAGWIAIIRIADPAELDDLKDIESYQAAVEDEE
ncbi:MULTISPECIES: glycine cleavage system protein GcvH [unclassified Vibrio]|uniref:Glycine cleavage system H protein n=1 Tax=Vibrio sp. HB236076 TaxID=3232307 RepID=A0AB39HM61_9VIBR|nr:glycine cleavage system protein GcvH [Vibrio sp. HB161653]MDP5252941.1 glycine cleavage system protein GcvH [Vibrio sp. HB161653]